MLVKFIHRFSPFQPGEIAGVPDEKAKKLIEAGIVEVYQVTPKTKDIEAPVNRMVKKPKVKK